MLDRYSIRRATVKKKWRPNIQKMEKEKKKLNYIWRSKENGAGFSATFLLNKNEWFNRNYNEVIEKKEIARIKYLETGTEKNELMMYLENDSKNDI